MSKAEKMLRNVSMCVASYSVCVCVCVCVCLHYVVSIICFQFESNII